MRHCTAWNKNHSLSSLFSVIYSLQLFIYQTRSVRLARWIWPSEFVRDNSVGSFRQGLNPSFDIFRSVWKLQLIWIILILEIEEIMKISEYVCIWFIILYIYYIVRKKISSIWKCLAHLEIPTSEVFVNNLEFTRTLLYSSVYDM